ncbi:MAG TPA: glycine betaine ABC transporter substrate-binding protein [Pseudogracilibacillus sp.]|nr:glycine betaine ABC transporter substrate-binding protein [Pseudogracilibacillus sp.]
MLNKITSTKFMMLALVMSVILVLAACGDSNSDSDGDGNDNESTAEKVGESVDWEITGIDPGAGIMGSAEDAMEEYDLEDDWDLQESSESAMISTLQEKYENEEPIIFTGWKPHWIFADMDLKMLDDPKEVFGGDGDEINLVFNKDFEDAHPAAYDIATKWAEDWSEDDEDELMPPIFVDDEDEEQVAQDFIDDNQDRVDGWTEDAEDMDLGDEKLSIPYVAWAGSTSRSPVLAKALEEVGYEVSVEQVEAGPMWTSVADSEDTLMATAWLPATHNEYIEEYEDDVEVYDTPLVDKAPLALTVPEYMEDVDSIEDLKVE